MNYKRAIYDMLCSIKCTMSDKFKTVQNCDNNDALSVTDACAVKALDKISTQLEEIAVLLGEDIVVPDVPVVPDAPTAEQAEGVISGVAEPNAVIKIYDEEGNVVDTTTANSDGAYTYDVPVEYNGQTLTVTATDAEGNESEATSVNIMFEGVEPPPDVPDPDVPDVPQADVAPEVFVNGIGKDCASGLLEISVNTDAYVTATDSNGVTLYAGVLSSADKSITLNRPIADFETVTFHAVNSMGSFTYDDTIVCM